MREGFENFYHASNSIFSLQLRTYLLKHTRCMA